MDKTPSANRSIRAAKSKHTTVATVVRTAGDSLIYAVLEPGNATVFISLDAIAGYKGESLAELGLHINSTLLCVLNDNSSTVKSAEVYKPPLQKQSARTAGSSQNRFSITERPISNAQQRELHPDVPPSGIIKAARALPLATRSFGKLVNTDSLRAGDLILTREINPTDSLSKLIQEVQLAGGYQDFDARWTHAATYLGDGANVVEATVDGFLSGGNVRITSLDEYCGGSTAFRFRRPRFVENECDGYKMCIRALAKLRQPYDVIQAARIWFDTIVKGRGFFDAGGDKSATSSAVLCSTLYADSYCEVTRRVLGEVNGTCVPGWLSASTDFDDLEVVWLSIQ